MKKKPLALWIFTGLALGIVAGMLLMSRPDIAEMYIKPFGTLFLNLLKFIVVPIVLFSIMNGVISMKDIKKVGSIGGKTVIYYMCTTFFAVTLGLVIANHVQKGISGAVHQLSGVYGSRNTQFYPDTDWYIPQQYHPAYG